MESNINRFAIKTRSVSGGDAGAEWTQVEARMVQDPSGKWVSYEDHTNILELTTDEGMRALKLLGDKLRGEEHYKSEATRLKTDNRRLRQQLSRAIAELGAYREAVSKDLFDDGDMPRPITPIEPTAPSRAEIDAAVAETMKAALQNLLDDMFKTTG